MNLILFNHSELNIEGNTKFSAFLPLHDKRSEHLLKVLHKSIGGSFDAGILGGKTGSGTIIEIASLGMLVTLNLENDPPPRTPLVLGVGFPRPIQLRRLLRDCASLGLAAVDLFGTELGEKSYRNTKLLDDGGARSALIEGAVQARDTQIPKLALFPNLSAWLDKAVLNVHGNNALFAADNVKPQGSFSGIKQLQPEAKTVLAIGPERGWSGRERKQLENAGFVRLSLGERALRTETACIAAAVLVMEKMGRL